MPDWTDQWREHLDEQARRVVERAVVHLDDLQVRYLGLRGIVGAGSGHGGGDVTRNVPGPRVPVRLDVVDLARDVEVFSTRYAGLVAGALRAGRPNVRSIVGALSYVGEYLGPAALADPSLAGDVETKAAGLRWRARHLVGDVSAAFPVDVDCPGCGLMSLWVHPGRGVVKCGVEACGQEWSVGDLAVPAWSTGQE